MKLKSNTEHYNYLLILIILILCISFSNNFLSCLDYIFCSLNLHLKLLIF